MPVPMLRSFARKAGKSLRTVEQAWKRAKKIARQQYGPPGKSKAAQRRFWGTTVRITKNIVGLNPSTASLHEYHPIILSTATLAQTLRRQPSHFAILPCVDFLRLTAGQLQFSIDNIFRASADDLVGATEWPWMVVNQHGQVIDHDGRHRAMATLKEKHTWMPVMIVAQQPTLPILTAQFNGLRVDPWRWFVEPLEQLQTATMEENAAADNMNFNSVLRVLAGLVAMEYYATDDNAFSAWFKKLQPVKTLDTWFPLSKVLQAAKPFAKKWDKKTIEKYLDAVTIPLADAIGDNKSKVLSDATISHEQRDLFTLLERKIRTGDLSDSAYATVARLIRVLHEPMLSNHFKLDTATGDAKQALRDLRFLVKSETGQDRDYLTPEERTRLKGKRKEDYARLTKILRESYKGHIMDIVRGSGKPHLHVDVLRRELAKRGVTIHSIPEGYGGHMDERGKLFTHTGKELEGYPTPGYKDLKMNPAYDPAKDDVNYFTFLPAKKDARAKQKTAYVYTKDYWVRQRAEKYGKISTLTPEKIKEARNRWGHDLLGANREKQLLGAMCELLYQYGVRPGSSTSSATKGKATAGLTTWTSENIIDKGRDLLIRYRSLKSGKPMSHLIRGNAPNNRRLIEVLRAAARRAGPGNYIFMGDRGRITSNDLSQYIKRLPNLESFTSKDFRTLKGTGAMLQALRDHPFKKKKPPPSVQKQAEEYYKKLALAIGKDLGHVRGEEGVPTATTALKSYIDPQIGVNFFKENNLIEPKWHEAIHGRSLSA